MNPIDQAKKMVDDHDKQVQRDERIKRLASYEGEDQVIAATVLRDILAEKRANCQTVAFASGIHKLDELIGGFQGGELTVISGKTKHGKTLLAQTFTKNMGLAIPSVWFSYEVRAEQFIAQFGNNVPFFVMPAKLKSNDTFWLEERIIEAILKYDCKAAFIDNTHNLLNMAGDNLTHKIDEFVKRLKEICVGQNMHIFLLHHIAKHDVGRVEDLNSNMLRDSSMIPQTADNVFFIFRDDTGAWLKITENRRNGVFNKSVRLQKVGYFFEEVSEVPVTDSTYRSGKSYRRSGDE